MLPIQPQPAISHSFLMTLGHALALARFRSWEGRCCCVSIRAISGEKGITHTQQRCWGISGSTQIEFHKHPVAAPVHFLWPNCSCVSRFHHPLATGRGRPFIRCRACHLTSPSRSSAVLPEPAVVTRPGSTTLKGAVPNLGRACCCSSCQPSCSWCQPSPCQSSHSSPHGHGLHP